MFKEENQKLIANITCTDFADAVQKVNQIAELAEKMNHHPDLRIYSYKMLEITIYTHTTNDISDKDYQLAEKITAFFKS